MSAPALRRRAFVLTAALVPVLALFVYVAVNSGPMAPVIVTLAQAEVRTITPSLFGIATVEARHSYRIGPTAAGRLESLFVDVGDAVAAGQHLGAMAPVDLGERAQALEAAIQRGAAGVQEAEARHSQADDRARRYRRLFELGSISEEQATAARDDLRAATAALTAAQAGLASNQADREALTALQDHLKLVAPAAGLVVARHADPGTTLVAGEAVVEVVDTGSLWLNARFDQRGSAPLASGQKVNIELRSRGKQSVTGKVLWVEPVADTVTEETRAKILFDPLPAPLPAIGELAEVTVSLPVQSAVVAVPNSAIHRQNGVTGVWKITGRSHEFVPITLGVSGLDGWVEVVAGVAENDLVVHYSEAQVSAGRRLKVVDSLEKTAP